jgi:signal transduction histidine kinase/ActR/RegA family two-component response regulator
MAKEGETVIALCKRWLAPWWQHLDRQRLLGHALLLLGSISLIFGSLPEPGYDTRANLLTSLLLFLMWPLAFRAQHHTRVVHAMLIVLQGLLSYICSQTGGINSPATVWMTILPIGALFLLQPRAAVAWLVVVYSTLVLMMFATRAGWIGAHVTNTVQAVPWALLNNALVVSTLMLAVFLYDHLHREQIADLDQKNQALERTGQALLQAQAHKDEFVAAVGHELRTPMNAILGLNSVLQSELADMPEQAEIAEHIRSSTQHLLQVVNDILDYSQLQAGQVTFFPEPCEWQTGIEEAMADQRRMAMAQGLDFTLIWTHDTPRWLVLDMQRLGQVLRQLVDNALKFTRQGHIRLSFSYELERLHIEVEDSGPGIPAQVQEHIFRRFEHAEQQTQKTSDGTGLGLAICERLVSLQGGRIGVRSTPGQGACFWLDWPCAEPLHAPAASVSSDVLPAGLRILLADDNAVNLMVAQLQMRKLLPDAQIIQADGGISAMEKIMAMPLDVAFIDMVMPDMDGLELTRRVRAIPGPQAGLPIVALTANTNPVDRQRCLQAGMNEVLHKPMEAAQIRRVLTRLLRERRT